MDDVLETLGLVTTEEDVGATTEELDVLETLGLETTGVLVGATTEELDVLETLGVVTTVVLVADVLRTDVLEVLLDVVAPLLATPAEEEAAQFHSLLCGKRGILLFIGTAISEASSRDSVSRLSSCACRAAIPFATLLCQNVSGYGAVKSSEYLLQKERGRQEREGCERLHGWRWLASNLSGESALFSRGLDFTIYDFEPWLWTLGPSGIG
ncbi:uncharacterized protein LY89DRAFT_718049 [Mollisia scopiformis]|uniref:Uncharacterized protein n=1 Tax=Mollisia scopiformis TaxID=149040 RepID=A0A194XAX7_MOLSC|nr:uncharacterized protein LY89DRAFT_718049 [Mollisia scopiformis]KUJ17326.1 hypothetical protein LY89DRAFT_718049 [Mollisia scopiformis]